MPAAHKERTARMRQLGISHRAAAQALGVAPSVFSRYALDGKITPSMGGDFIARLDAYIEGQAGASVTGFKSAPMVGSFYKVETSLGTVAARTGIDQAELKRGIYEGHWAEERIYKKIKTWIEEQIEKKEKAMLTRKSLPPEVVEFYGLKRDPFNLEMAGPDAVFEMKELARIERQVIHSIEHGGWIAITGPAGSGKTTLIRRIKSRVASMPRREIILIEPRTLQKENLRASHVVDAILEDLGAGISSNERTLEHKARRVAHVLAETRRDGKRAALLIDEAHMLPPQILLALKRLYEIEADYERLLAIVLVGQEPLARVLKTNFSVTEVAQRVDLVELAGINGSLGFYIGHKLERAGCTKELFDPSAIRAIGKRFSTPLAINNACAAALIHAHSLGEKRVNGEIVDGVLGSN